MRMGNKRGLKSNLHVNKAFWVEKDSVLDIVCGQCLWTGIRTWGEEIRGALMVTVAGAGCLGGRDVSWSPAVPCAGWHGLGLRVLMLLLLSCSERRRRRGKWRACGSSWRL